MTDRVKMDISVLIINSIPFLLLAFIIFRVLFVKKDNQEPQNQLNQINELMAENIILKEKIKV